MHYLILKLLHVAAVVLFLGNITLGLFWMAHAMRSGEARIIAHTMDGIIRSDRWFTVPAVLAIIGAGVGAAVLGQMRLLHTGWIAWSLALFALSGLVFGTVLAPLQRRIRDYAAQSGADFDIRRLPRVGTALGSVGLGQPAAGVGRTGDDGAEAAGVTTRDRGESIEASTSRRKQESMLIFRFGIDRSNEARPWRSPACPEP